MVVGDNEFTRKIRSFVRREGRMTKAQQRALDQLWPKYGLSVSGGLCDVRKTFGRDAPLVLEIGFGMGASLLEMAQSAPEKNFIGVEVHRPGVGALLTDIEKHAVDNVRLYAEDALDVLDQCIADESLDALQLFFPDPWPKKRHHKRRIVQPAFAEIVACKLKSAGTFHCTTDWQEYAHHMMDVVSNNAHFINPHGAGRFAPRPKHRPKTKFEQRGERLGHKVWDLIFIKEISSN